MWSYHAWWRAADLTETYEYHRRVCLLLQSRRPPNLWLFKAPHHKFHLEPLVAAYPDIRFVMTHRDPAKVGAVVLQHRVDRLPGSRGRARIFDRVGPRSPSICASAWKTPSRHGSASVRTAFSTSITEDVLTDLRGTMRRVYDFLGFELTPAVEQSFIDYQERNATGARGSHRYTPEQFGLTTAQLRSDYDFYIQRFGVHSTLTFRRGTTSVSGTIPADLGRADAGS